MCAGTGILGLPVKLTRTGFGPFVLSYSITFVMQVFTLIYTVELMQRVHLIHLCQVRARTSRCLSLSVFL